MKTRVMIVSIVVGTTIIGCSKSVLKSSDTVFVKYDSNGKIVERWGFERLEDEVNFREFRTYNEDGKLIQLTYYQLDDENRECILSKEDSLNAVEFYYEYDTEGNLIEEQIYDPKHDDKGNIVGRELRHSKNPQTGRDVPDK